MRKLALAITLGTLGTALGCDDGPRVRRPPADETGAETAEDFRDRRRDGPTAVTRQPREEEPRSQENRRPEDDRRAQENRRRRIDEKRKERAIEAAEDAADAATDRPLRPN